MKLSIIIALYNTEIYIEKCIRSIYINNNLSNDSFEVIVINDGSTDNSKSIVEQMMKEYSNIQLINKENGGQSTARNIGFNLAKGEYFFCLDSDDSINAKELSKALFYCISNNLDVLPVYYQVYDQNHKLLTRKKADNYPIINKAIDGGIFMSNYTISGSMWRYFYKTSLLKQHNLKLTEGIFHEDEEFVIKFLSYSKKISYKRHLVYNHVIRDNSTVNKKEKKHRLKLLDDLIVVVNQLTLHRSNFKEYSLNYIGISKKIEQLIISIFLRMKEDNLNYDERMSFKIKLQSINMYPIRIKYLGFKFKIVSFLLNSKLFNKIYYK